MAKGFEKRFWVLLSGNMRLEGKTRPNFYSVSILNKSTDKGREKKCFCRLAAQLQAQWDPVLREWVTEQDTQYITLFTLWAPPTIPATHKKCPPTHTRPHTHSFHEKWAYTQNAYNQPNKTNRTIPIFTKPFSLTTIKHDRKTRHLCRGLRDGWAVKNTYCSIMKTRISIPWHTSNMSQCL